MTNTFADKLSVLEELAAQRDSSAKDQLAPGIARSESLKVAARIGLVLPDQALDWFEWHNGSLGPQLARICGTTWLAERIHHLAEETERRREEASAFAAELGIRQPDAGWASCWFPLARSIGGTTLAIDCSDQSFGAIRSVGVVGKGRVEPDVIDAFSLEDVVDLWIDSHRRGAYAYGAGGWSTVFDLLPERSLAGSLY